MVHLLQILTTLVEGLSVPVTCKIRVLPEVSVCCCFCFFFLLASYCFCSTTHKTWKLVSGTRNIKKKPFLKWKTGCCSPPPPPPPAIHPHWKLSGTRNWREKSALKWKTGCCCPPPPPFYSPPAPPSTPSENLLSGTRKGVGWGGCSEMKNS